MLAYAQMRIQISGRMNVVAVSQVGPSMRECLMRGSSMPPPYIMIQVHVH